MALMPLPADARELGIRIHIDGKVWANFTIEQLYYFIKYGNSVIDTWPNASVVAIEYCKEMSKQ